MLSIAVPVPLESHQMVSKGQSAFWDTVRPTLSFSVCPHPVLPNREIKEGIEQEKVMSICEAALLQQPIEPSQ